jgi:glycosyltransferase involved in cell wall biosynthesis
VLAVRDRSTRRSDPKPRARGWGKASRTLRRATASASPSRVLVVLTSLAAEGTPRLVLELCRIWQQQGIRPVVALLRARPDDLAPEFDALGIERVCLGMGGRGYARYGRLALELFRLARRHRADALLSMPLGWHTFMAYGARLGGVRRVAAHVGNYPTMSGAAFRKFRAQVQLGRPATTALVCCSRYVQEGVVARFGIDPGETAVVHNGVPVAAFAERARAARRQHKASRFRIGMVARLEAHKDQPTLIRAAGRLGRRGLDCEVWLIGEGSRRCELEALIAEEGLRDRVHLLGMRRDVAELVGRIDLFVFATTPDEGLGIALIEAMAAGVPVVASDVGACREVLDDGALGLLVPPRDPLALADAIECIRHEPEAAAERAERARRKAFELFDAERMAAAYAGLLGLNASGAASALQAA